MPSARNHLTALEHELIEPPQTQKESAGVNSVSDMSERDNALVSRLGPPHRTFGAEDSERPLIGRVECTIFNGIARILGGWAEDLISRRNQIYILWRSVTESNRTELRVTLVTRCASKLQKAKLATQRNVDNDVH